MFFPLDVLAGAAVGAAGSYFYAVQRFTKKGKPIKMAHQILQQRASDHPGYVHLVLSDPVGTSQAGASVVCESHDHRHEIILHGQREFDVLAGSLVTFPDGSQVHIPQEL